jgi:Arc/MetJ-type ribon-helix-helix transcriptional regulator
MAQIGVRKGNVIKLSISISEDSADWIESQVESQRYRNISHAIESVIREKKANAQA